MKKINLLYTFILLLFISFGCASNDEEILFNDNQIEPTQLFKSKGRSIEEASKIASEALDILKDKNSRSAGRTFNASNVKIQFNHASRSANPDTLYYVFNFDNNQGFAIVTYNRHAEALLAITEEGNYNPAEKTGVDGFDGYMANVEKYLSSLPPTSTLGDIPLIPGVDTIPTINENDTVIGRNPLPDFVEYKFEKKILESKKTEPNYNLKWGQYYPAGLLFENHLCGCTNLAIAMCMSYIQKPESISLTYPGKDSDNLFLNWNLIKEHTFLYDGCSYDVHYTLAKLCRELGHRNHSVCNGDTATSTSRGYVIPTLKSLGLECSDLTPYHFESVHNTLCDKNAVIAFGQTVKKDSPSGHAFVLDGTMYERYWTGEYIREPGKDWELVNDHGIQYTKMTHVNWGWDGKYNGYFGTAPFCASTGTNYDNPNQKTDTENYKDYYYGNIYTISIYK